MVSLRLREKLFCRSRGSCYWIKMSRSVNRIVTIGLVALLPACASTRHAAVKDTTKTFKTVVVDAGHGGKDSRPTQRDVPGRVGGMRIPEQSQRRQSGARFGISRVTRG